MKFGDIDSTVFGFGEKQDDEPCFCWLHSQLEINVNTYTLTKRGESLAIKATHIMYIFCSKDVQPKEKFSARFTGSGKGMPGEAVRIKWDIYKMCGACKEIPGGIIYEWGQKPDGCIAQGVLCSEEMGDVPDTYGPPGKRWRLYNSPAQNLWRLRWDLKQKEAEVKSICKKIRKMFEKCKFDMACHRTEKVCGGHWPTRNFPPY